MERQIEVFTLVLVTSLKDLILMRFGMGKIASIDAVAPQDAPLPVEQARVAVFRAKPAVTRPNPAAINEAACVEPRDGVGSKHV